MGGTPSPPPAGRGLRVSTKSQPPIPQAESPEPAETRKSGIVRGAVVLNLDQDTPPLKQVRVRVGRLDPALDDMRQGCLDHLPEMIRLLFHCPPSLCAVPTS